MIGFEPDAGADAGTYTDTDAVTVTDAATDAAQGGTWRIITEVFGKR